MNAYQAEIDPTKVMGRRIGAYLIDIVLGLILIAIVTSMTLTSHTVSGRQAEQFQGVQNLCARELNMSDLDEFSMCLDPETVQGSDFDGYFVIWSRDNDENLLIDHDRDAFPVVDDFLAEREAVGRPYFLMVFLYLHDLKFHGLDAHHHMYLYHYLVNLKI